MIKKFILIICVTLALTSCNLTEKIHFNGDYSGNVEYTIDYSWFANMKDMAENKVGDNLEIDSVIRESIARGKLDQFNGIKNFSYRIDSSSTITIHYEFDNLEALNAFSGKSQIIENAYSGNSTRHFSARSKKFTYTKPLAQVDSLDESLEGFKEYLNYKLILSFEKEIKKVSNPEFMLSDNRKQVSWEGTFADLFSKDKKSDIVINFK